MSYKLLKLIMDIGWKTARFCILNFSTTERFITRSNTSKFVKNTPLRVVFSTLISVFDLVMKHCVSCLIYYF